MSIDVYKPAIKAWVEAQAGITAQWRDEQGGWQAKTRARLHLSNILPRGVDMFRYNQDLSLAAGEDLVPTISGLRELLLEIKVTSRDQSEDNVAIAYLDKLRRSLRKRSVRTSLNAAGLAHSTTEVTQDVTTILDDRRESVAVMEVHFNAVVNERDAEEATGHVETFKISSALIADSGRDRGSSEEVHPDQTASVGTLLVDLPLIASQLESATVATDRTGNGHHATATGTPPTFSDNDGIDLDPTGNDHLVVADAAALSFLSGSADGPFTLACWLYLDDATSFPIATKGTVAGGDQEWAFEVGSADKLVLSSYDESASASWARTCSVPLTAREGGWVHVAVSSDGTNKAAGVRFYVNGSLVSSVSSATGTYVAREAAAGDVHLGRLGATYGDGKMQLFQAWAEVLTPSDIRDTFDAGRLG
jgi:uncharacterized protein (UPF0254 family)